MKRLPEIRTYPRDWRRVLTSSYPFLRQRGTGDLLLYGSQAMSVYMKTALRSKDLDLVSSQMGPNHLEALRRELARDPSLEVRSSTIQSRTLTWGEMKTYSLELRLGQKPFFIEIFDKVLDGKPPSIVTPHIQAVQKWGLDLWVPSRNALVALRLSFRQPEGITSLNCNRLNRFIKEQARKIQFKAVSQIIRQWGTAPLVQANLEQLHKRHRLKILHEKEILASLPE